MKGGLLNPPLEAAVCRKMITEVEEALRAYEHALTHTVLDREKYLQTVGKAEATRNLLLILKSVYAREFDK